MFDWLFSVKKVLKTCLDIPAIISRSLPTYIVDTRWLQWFWVTGSPTSSSSARWPNSRKESEASKVAIGPAAPVAPPGQSLKTPWSVPSVSRSSWTPQSTRAKTFTVFATGIQVHPQFYAKFLLILFFNNNNKISVIFDAIDS